MGLGTTPLLKHSYSCSITAPPPFYTYLVSQMSSEVRPKAGRPAILGLLLSVALRPCLQESQVFQRITPHGIVGQTQAVSFRRLRKQRESLCTVRTLHIHSVQSPLLGMWNPGGLQGYMGN